MAELQTTEFAGHFATPKEPYDPVVEVRVPFALTAITGAANDTVSLCVLPAGWVVSGGFVQVTTALATTATMDVGLHNLDLTNNDGTLGSAVDVDAYADAINIGIVEGIQLLADTTLAGVAAQTVDTAVTATLLTMTTPAAGTFFGYVKMYNQL